MLPVAFAALTLLAPLAVLATLAVSASLTGCRSQSTAPRVPEVAEAAQPEESAAVPETVVPQTEEQILRRQLVTARKAFQEGSYEISRQILMAVTDPTNPEIRFLQAQIALAQADKTLAAFYLKQVVDGGARQLETQQMLEAHRLLAELSYESGDLERAYRSYLQTVNLSGGDVPADVWLRLAEIALFSRADAESARIFLLDYRASRQAQPPQDRLLERLSKRLSWGGLSPEQVGLNDANISALEVDGDDLWIGTWNGGISRYSIGQRSATVFETGSESLIPRTVRSIEVTPTRVWVGTYQGLYQYTKPSSRWQKIGFLDEKVEALCAAGGTLYVGTLGRGLWRSRGEKWEKIGWGGLPGEFVNCLEVQDDHLLIGTLNLGLVIMSLKTGAIFSFDSVNPNLQARNVIALLAENDDTLWIGTYGEGLYRWERGENRLEHFSRASGEIADDWVLCAVRAESGLYFGTFGGGVSRFLPEKGLWERIGLGQGLSALDISSVTYAAPRLFFGTLGSGVSVLDESLVLDGSGGIE